MKKSFKFLSTLLCAVAVVGCADEPSVDSFDNAADVASSLSVTTNTLESRVSLTDNTTDSKIEVSWKVGEEISIFDSTDAYVCDFTCSDATTGTFTSTTTLETGSYKAVYPATNTLEGRGSITEMTQEQSESIAHLEDVLYMSGDFNFDSGSESNSLTFDHDVALMKITFRSTVDGETPTKVVFTNGDVGTYTLNLSNVTSGDTYVSYIMIDACEEGVRELTFVITYSDNSEDSYSVTTSKVYVAGVCYTAGVDALTGTVDAAAVNFAITDLPATAPAYCATTTDSFTFAYTMSESFSDSNITWESEDEDVATVSAANGTATVTLKGDYGYGTINALYDGIVVGTYEFTVPGGWWIEEFNTNVGTFSTNSAATTYTDILFGAGNTNNSNSATGNGYVEVSVGYTQTYTKENFTVDGVTHTELDKSLRADIWCYNESICVLNANTYPYLVFHLDDNTVKNNVIYHEFGIRLDYSDNGYTSFTDENQDGYADSRMTPYFLDNGTIMLVYDMSYSSFYKDQITNDLTSKPDSYDTPTSISMNYFMYGYGEETVSDGYLFPAMTDFNYNIYSVQTFASTEDIDEYISDLGLNKLDSKPTVTGTAVSDELVYETIDLSSPTVITTAGDASFRSSTYGNDLSYIFNGIHVGTNNDWTTSQTVSASGVMFGANGSNVSPIGQSFTIDLGADYYLSEVTMWQKVWARIYGGNDLSAFKVWGASSDAVTNGSINTDWNTAASTNPCYVDENTTSFVTGTALDFESMSDKWTLMFDCTMSDPGTSLSDTYYEIDGTNTQLTYRQAQALEGHSFDVVAAAEEVKVRYISVQIISAFGNVNQTYIDLGELEFEGARVY